MVRYAGEEPVMHNAEEFSGQRRGFIRVLPQGLAGHHGGDANAAGRNDAQEAASPDTGLWPAEPPAGGRHSDTWVLVCGGIAAAAAFAAAFVASGGTASHPAAPGAMMPAVVSQACPAPVSGPTP
jgi:hypothetical protein